MTLRRKLSSFCDALVILVVATIVAAAILVVECRFYPGRRVESASAGSDGKRVFTVTSGWLDISANLYASDWPHTLMEPVRLDDLYWPESYDASARWSGDGSVVAVMKRWNTRPDRFFSSAYDFHEHRVIRGDHAGIASLVTERGGWEGAVVRWDDGKGGEHPPRKPLPLWAWVLPALVMGLGFLSAKRRLRFRFPPDGC